MAIQADLRAASCRTDWLRTGAGYRQCCRRKRVVGYLNLLVLLCTEADADSGPHGRGLPDQAASEGLCRPMLEPAARVLAWLKRNLRTFQFIDDDPRAGGECCLTDGHGCWQSGDTLRPITMPLRNLSLRVWRHSSSSLKRQTSQIAARKRPGGLRHPRTMMQAQHRSAHAATIRKEMRSQRMQLRTVRRINGADLTLS